jgi:hypothetical protein
MDLFSVFKNLKYKIIEDTCFNRVVQMSSEEAFDFSSIIGSNYLDNFNGFSMKGRNEVFIHRSVFHENSLIYSPGLFARNEKLELKDENSGFALKDKFPNVFDGQKKIIIYKLEKNERSNIEGKVIKTILDSKLNPNDYLLFKYRDLYKNLEPFLEWLSFEYFKKKGYMFENQCPFFQQSFKYNNKNLTGGIPDVSAFKTKSFKVLEEYNILNNHRGILINKLSNLLNFNIITKKKEKIKSKYNYELIIGEAKTDKSSLNQALTQLTKYNNVELADHLYSIIPNCKNNTNPLFGEMYIENNKLYIKDSNRKLSINNHNQKIDEEWLDIYIRINLMGNLSFQKLTEHLKNFNNLKKNEKIYSSHLLNFASKTSTEEILKLILN